MTHPCKDCLVSCICTKMCDVALDLYKKEKAYECSNNLNACCLCGCEKLSHNIICHTCFLKIYMKGII